MMSRGSTTLILSGLLALVLSLGLVPGGSAAAAAACTSFASPTGSNESSGTRARPYRTVQKLVDSLGPGDTGCLDRGTYQQEELTLATPGIRLTSFSDESARIVGRIRVVEAG